MEVLVAIFGPMLVFGLFALLAVRYGAESRPYFDERPVVDDRPNWFPIPGSRPDDDEDDDDEPHGGEPIPVPEAARAVTAARTRRQPAVPVASSTSAATSPSGV
jgi:hypothetical protein